MESSFDKSGRAIMGPIERSDDFDENIVFLPKNTVSEKPENWGEQVLMYVQKRIHPITLEVARQGLFYNIMHQSGAITP